MSIKGVPKFNSLVLGTVEANFMKPTIELKAVAAFADTETGMTHGWTRGEGDVWSKETLTKLQELRELMTNDLANRHFSGIAKEVSASGKKVPIKFESGLGEFLNTDAPSV